MTISRTARLAAVAVAGVLALAACGSDGGSSASSSGDANCVSGSLKASGSSAQKNAMAEWINGYQSNCSGATIDYQANGSGAGIQDFINKQTAFAGSDSALKDDDKTAADARCATGPAIDIPMVGGAIVAAYNVSGVDKLILTLGRARRHLRQHDHQVERPEDRRHQPRRDPAGRDDRAVPPQRLVGHHRQLHQVHRHHLDRVDLRQRQGVDRPRRPGRQGLGRRRQRGEVAPRTPSATSSSRSPRTPSSPSRLDRQRLRHRGRADLGERRRRPSPAATITGTGNDLALSIDYKTTAGYPAVLVTYEITCEKGLEAGLVDLTKSFLTYTASDAGQAKLTDLGYVPITGDLLTKVRTAVSSISA